MPSSTIDYITQDLLYHLPNITTKPMFGGHGIYQDGYIFGIVAWDKLYLKTGGDQEHAKRLEELGGEQFIYEKGNHKKTAMNYWTVSFDTLEDRELCRELVTKSVDISRASKKK